MKGIGGIHPYSRLYLLFLQQVVLLHCSPSVHILHFSNNVFTPLALQQPLHTSRRAHPPSAQHIANTGDTLTA